jgi:hypothetical protein
MDAALKQGWEINIKMYGDIMRVRMRHDQGWDECFECYTITTMLVTTLEISNKYLEYTSNPNFPDRKFDYID